MFSPSLRNNYFKALVFGIQKEDVSKKNVSGMQIRFPVIYLQLALLFTQYKTIQPVELFTRFN